MNLNISLKTTIILLLSFSLSYNSKASEYRPYTEVNDIEKLSAQVGATAPNLFFVNAAAVSPPYATQGNPNVPSHNVQIDFSAYTVILDGNSYQTNIDVRYYASGSISPGGIAATVSVGPLEKRYSVSLNAVPNNVTKIALFQYGVNVPITPNAPTGKAAVAVVRDFRTRYTNSNSPYTEISPICFNYNAPLDNQSMTGWPAITNNTSTGVGISGTTSFFDNRANMIDHVLVSIQRLSDGAWWTGSYWQYSYWRLSANHTNSLWSMNQVPTGANLSPGNYRIFASAHDQADSNFGSHFASEGIIDVTIVSPPPPPNVAPVNVSVTPSTGSSAVGIARALTCTYRDPNGGTDIARAWLRIRAVGSSSNANSLYGYFNRSENKMYLLNDAGTAYLGGFAPGSNNTISNAQGSLNCATSTVTISGTDLTVKWVFTPTSTFQGVKDLWTYVDDTAAVADGWDDLGDWTIGDAISPNQSILTSPTPNSTLPASSLTSLYGNCSDNTGGSGINRVGIQLVYLGSGGNESWNWQTATWGADDGATNKIKNGTLNGTATIWNISSGLPNTSTNRAGRYRVVMTTYDNAGNPFSWNYQEFNVSSAIGRTLNRNSTPAPSAGSS